MAASVILASLVTVALAGATTGHAQTPPDNRPDESPAAQPDDTQPEDAPNPDPQQPDQPPAPRPWAEGVSGDAQAKASELFEAGDALLQEFQLAEALEKYQSALSHWRHPAIHYRVASILLSQGKQVQAYEQAELSLRYGELPLGKQFFDNATRIKKQMESTLVWLTVECQEAGAEVRLDGELLFTAPGREERIISAGAHTVVATKAGMIPGTENLVLQPGARTSVQVTLRIEGAKERFYPSFQRWGGTAVTLIDAQGFNPTKGEGLATLIGASYGLRDNLDIEVGAVLSGQFGAYFSAVFYLRKGLWRPTVFLGIPVLFADSIQPGARTGVGIEYTPTSWLAVVAQAGFEYFPRADTTHVSTLFAPTVGVKLRR